MTVVEVAMTVAAVMQTVALALMIGNDIRSGRLK